MSPFRFHREEEDLTELLERFAQLEVRVKKERWEWERRWKEVFQAPRVKHSSRAEHQRAALHGLDAEEAYDRIVTQGGTSSYAVVPEEPWTIAFRCTGRLPCATDWRTLLRPEGLLFDITVFDLAFTWTFVMHREETDLCAEFWRAPRIDVDVM